MKLSGISVLAIMALAAASAAAAEIEPNAFLVIANGSKDPKQAQAQLDDYKAKGYPSLRGWPRLLASESVEGLKPGFHVLAVAAPERETVAKELTAALKRLGLGAYYRPVKTPAAADLRLFILENVYFEGGQPKRPSFSFTMADATSVADQERQVVFAFVWEAVDSGMIGIILNTGDPRLECDTLLIPKPERGAEITRHGLPGAIQCWPAEE